MTTRSQIDRDSSGYFAVSIGASQYAFKIQDVQYISMEHTTVVVAFYNADKLCITIPPKISFSATNLCDTLKTALQEHTTKKEELQFMKNIKDGLIPQNDSDSDNSSDNYPPIRPPIRQR